MTNLNAETIKTASQDTLLVFITKAFAGFIAAVIVLGIGSFLLVFLWIFIDFFIHPGVSTPPELAEKIRISFGTGFFVSAYAVLTAILCIALFGLPAIFVGWRLKLVHWWTCVVGGAILGCLPAVLITWNATSIKIVFTTFMFSGLLGAAAGISFWFVWQFFTHSLSK